MDARGCWIGIDGHRLEAAWWGRGQEMGPEMGPSIVLLHEGLGSVGLWRGFPAALARATGLGVFAWSRLGYGRSDPAALPRPFSYLHDEAALLPKVLDAAGIGRCLLLGHSDGASIAAIHAGCAPDPRMAGAVLIAPHVFVEPATLAGLDEARQRYASGGLRQRLARRHSHPDIAFHGWNGTWLDPGFAGWTLDRELAAIRLPLLVIQGEADPYGTAEHARRIAQRAAGPVELLLLPGIGHVPQSEAPEATLGAITRFCARLFSRP
jgi:pimeloyl-ACP methyl ester carboxylesterase